MKYFVSAEGNVIVEFIGITIALLVPLSIITNASIVIANSYLSTDMAARTAARAFVVSSSDTSATRIANSVVRQVVLDFDRDNTNFAVEVACTKSPCLSPGGFVTIKVSKNVNLNLPRMFKTQSMVVTSQHTAVVDELRIS